METDPEAVKSQLDRILASPVFAKSDRMSRFLRHIVEADLQRDPGRLKEYSIGLEVFDKGQDFDPRIDPVVRSEARRLRLKLAEYYLSEGSGDLIVIDLPKGSYLPAITQRVGQPAPPVPASTRRGRTAAIVALALVVLAAAGATAWLAPWRKPAPLRSLAVLPFESLSSDPENEYFSQGLTEEILNAVANIPEIKVVARTSTMQYKNKHVDVRLLGKLLNADTVLEGSVRKDGSRILITPQLIDANTGYHLWSMDFEREFRNILDVQKEIGAAVARGLKGHLVQPQPSAQPGPFVLALATNAESANPVTQLGMLDLGRGILRPHATLASALVGIGRDHEGRIYAVDFNNNLIRIDTVTGAIMVIGPTGLTKPGPSGPAVNVFASMSNGKFFLMDFDQVLYSVDKSTGAAGRIGATGITAITKISFGTSFSGDCEALYYTVGEDDEKGNSLIPATLYKIDPRTARALRVGPTASFLGGSGFVGKTLYGFKIDENLVSGTVGPQVVSIDLKTGAAKKVANLNVPSIYAAVTPGEEHGCAETAR